MTLDQFLKDNRRELIARARDKVASRSSPQTDAKELEHGVPLFLSQLSAALEDLGEGGTDQSSRASQAAHPAIDESAAQHGRDLLKRGFTIEQVVHDYGDVCQAVTELAEERGATMSLAEFHTLNKCLDNAIAGAVAAWSDERERERAQKTSPDARDAFMQELAGLVDRATTTFELLLQGRVAIGGATGGLLRQALGAMRALIDRDEAEHR